MFYVDEMQNKVSETITKFKDKHEPVLILTATPVVNYVNSLGGIFLALVNTS